MPLTWADDFTYDYFGDATYSVLVGTEGSTFTVAPNDLGITAGGICFWEDQRTNMQSLAGTGTLQGSLTVITTFTTSFPYIAATGFSDPTLSQWFVIGGIDQGMFGYALTDGVSGGAFSGTV